MDTASAAPPVTATTEEHRFDRERYNPNAFAAVRQGAREGTLLDAATDPIFIGLLLRNLRESLTVTEGNLQLEFRPTSQFSGGQVRQPESVRPVETGKSNSSALVDNDFCIKMFRRTEAGVNPAIEVGVRRRGTAERYRDRPCAGPEPG